MFIPKNYPFPSDEIVWSSVRANFNAATDSYIAVAKLPETHTVTVNGRKHNNTHRLVIYSPVRGPISIMTQETDAFSLISAGLCLLGPSDTAHGGKGSAHISASLFDRKLPVDVDFTPKDE